MESLDEGWSLLCVGIGHVLGVRCEKKDLRSQRYLASLDGFMLGSTQITSVWQAFASGGVHHFPKGNCHKLDYIGAHCSFQINPNSRIVSTLYPMIMM